MTGDNIPDRTVPLWLKVLIALDAFPVLALPCLMSAAPEGTGTFLCIYPIFTLLAAVCAWRCWRYSRVELTWILLAVLALTHVAMWKLACVI